MAVFLQLLDRFHIRGGDGPIIVSVTGQRLLALLALRGSVSRSVVAGTLWPDVTENRAHGSLRTTLWRLHQADEGIVGSTMGALSLTSAVHVDVRSFTERALRSLAGPDDHCLPMMLERGELLPGWGEEWVVFERERLRQLRLHALEAMAAHLLERRQFALALEAALHCIRLEPLRESAHRAIVAVHLAEHNVHEALQHYGTFQELVRDELAIEPSETFTAMVRPLMRR
ncbi:bacterial transcriptional activator domain-containing protein [Nonomuraea sp. NPDC050643]|uniref:AfsR/SARP family transcriptional regulator n=1 Tax=Nonomuraea sp. NPDC050643 TaxID=3155660 RepID=UPI0033D5CDB2